MTAFFMKWKAKFSDLLRDFQKTKYENDRLNVTLKQNQNLIVTLLQQVDELKVKVAALEAEKKSPKKVVEAVLGQKLKYRDLSKMDVAERTQYHAEAQILLRNEVLINEKNYYLEIFGEWCLKEAHDYAGIRDMRMTINGIELLYERLKEIPDPNVAHTEEEPFNGI